MKTTYKKFIYACSLLCSFLLGAIIMFFLVKFFISKTFEFYDKNNEIRTSRGLLINSIALLEIEQGNYSKAKTILEQDLLSDLMSVMARSKINNQVEIDDVTLRKAHVAFDSIDKKSWLNKIKFSSEKEMEIFESTLQSIDLFLEKNDSTRNSNNNKSPTNLK